jgi:hypothetical protein
VKGMGKVCVRNVSSRKGMKGIKKRKRVRD